MDGFKYNLLLNYLGKNGLLVDFVTNKEKLQKNDCGFDDAHEKKHNSFLNHIVNNLGKIGIYDENFAYKEVLLAGKRSYYGRADIIVLTKNELYLIEAKVLKSNSNIRLSQRKNSAIKQLKNYSMFFKDKFSLYPCCIVAYKNKKQNNNFGYQKIPKSIEDLFLLN